MQGEFALCDFACSHVLTLPSLLASPCRFTVRQPRMAAESQPLAISEGSHSDLPSLHTSPCKFSLQALAPDSFCHLCTLHRADSPSESLARLQNREPWRFQRARDRDLPSLHTSPCKFSLQALAPDSFCHLCTLQRADSPFESLARLQNRDPWRY